jgi:hypothetical protein
MSPRRQMNHTVGIRVQARPARLEIAPGQRADLMSALLAVRPELPADESTRSRDYDDRQASLMIQ